LSTKAANRPDIARAIAGARARNRAKVVTYLLQSVIARHRDKWADLLLRTALWMREAPLELDLCWRTRSLPRRSPTGAITRAKST
jgi:hypothetical protein